MTIVYKNTLGRLTGADAEGLAYWSGELSSGRETHGSLVAKILDSAHSFKNDATWSWVSNLLDNKLAAADSFAVDKGLNAMSAEASISMGMRLAAEVSSSMTPAEAIALIGLPDIHLAIVA